MTSVTHYRPKDSLFHRRSKIFVCLLLNSIPKNALYRRIDYYCSWIELNMKRLWPGTTPELYKRDKCVNCEELYGQQLCGNSCAETFYDPWSMDYGHEDDQVFHVRPYGDSLHPRRSFFLWGVGGLKACKWFCCRQFSFCRPPPVAFDGEISEWK